MLARGCHAPRPGHARELRRVQDADGGDQRRQIAADKGQHHQRDENLGQGHEHVHHADGGGLGAATQEGHAHADGHAQHASATAAAATVSDTRAPCTARDSRSRPSSSVPSQCFQVGEDSRLAASIWYGSCRPSMDRRRRPAPPAAGRPPPARPAARRTKARRTAHSGVDGNGRALMPAACGCGIDQPLGQVDGQADQDEDGEDGQQAALDDG